MVISAPNPVTVIFGGSFDPFHLGHANLVQQVLTQLAPEQLLLLPCYQQPLKVKSQTCPQDRLNMLHKISQQWPQVRVDAREIQSASINFTVDTLEQLRQQWPKHSLVFVLGYDSLQHIQRWQRWQQLLHYSHLLVINRPGIAASIQAIIPTIWQKNKASLSQLHMQTEGLIVELFCKPMAISSSQIRSDIDAFSDCLPEEIATYINQHRLYR